MALGLAIIFGQMGVINMAHGEFMILGAYMTYLTSHLFQSYIPRSVWRLLLRRYGNWHLWFQARRICRRVAADRHLYSRPLDTLLATWA